MFLLHFNASGLILIIINYKTVEQTSCIKMKFYSVMFVVLIVFSVCHGFSQPRIPNTKAEGCDASGNCGSVCSYDGVNIFPSQTYNAPGKCRLYQCTEDFTTLITPWVNISLSLK